MDIVRVAIFVIINTIARNFFFIYPRKTFQIYQKAKKEWADNYEYVPVYKLIRKDSAGFFEALKKIADKTSYEGITWTDFIAFDPGTDKMMQAAHKALQGKFFPERERIIF